MTVTQLRQVETETDSTRCFFCGSLLGNKPVPQTPPSAHDGSADKNPAVTLQKVVISTGRRGNPRGMDEEKVRTVRVEAWPWCSLPQLVERPGVGAHALLLQPMPNDLRFATQERDRSPFRAR
jgi:hypothetical protein